MYRLTTFPFQAALGFKPRHSSGGVSHVNVVSLPDIRVPLIVIKLLVALFCRLFKKSSKARRVKSDELKRTLQYV
jgi:hypothetical protein